MPSAGCEKQATSAVSCRWRKHHKTGVRKIFNIFLIDKRVAVRTIENDPYAQVCSLVRPTFSHPLVLRLSRRVVLRCPAERCRVARYRRERRILFPRTNFSHLYLIHSPYAVRVISRSRATRNLHKNLDFLLRSKPWHCPRASVTVRNVSDSIS